MTINETKHYFYILLFLTLSLYFFSDILKYKITNLITEISNYCKDNNIFEIPLIKIAYNEFKNETEVKFYIKKYEHLNNKKNNENLSQNEIEILSILEKDIEILKISFLSSLITNNKDLLIENTLLKKVKRFLTILKLSYVLKIIKTILTLSSTWLFIKIVFKI